MPLILLVVLSFTVPQPLDIHQTIKPLESGFHQTLSPVTKVVAEIEAYWKLTNIKDEQDRHSVQEIVGYWSAKLSYTCTKYPHSHICETTFAELVQYSMWIVEHSKEIVVVVGWQKYPTTVDPMVIAAIIWHESKLDEEAVGLNGRDSGLMQVCDKYVPETKVELLDPETNIKAGVGALGFWKVRPKFKKDWIAHYADGIYLGIRGLEFQAWVHKQVNTWRVSQQTATCGDPAG